MDKDRIWCSSWILNLIIWKTFTSPSSYNLIDMWIDQSWKNMCAVKISIYWKYMSVRESFSYGLPKYNQIIACFSFFKQNGQPSNSYFKSFLIPKPQKYWNSLRTHNLCVWNLFSNQFTCSIKRKFFFL